MCKIIYPFLNLGQIAFEYFYNVTIALVKSLLFFVIALVKSTFWFQEEYLDIPITVQGSTDLHTSLANSFIVREQLSGNNQYKCEKCNNEYRDAEKYCQLKNLPPILTFSLLRFTYDLKTYQRIKEIGKFEFPLELDLNSYMEDSFKLHIDTEYSKYELFSVIIHSGSAYGGHYHTYIKDFDNLGEWSLKDEYEVEKAGGFKKESSTQLTESSIWIILK